MFSWKEVEEKVGEALSQWPEGVVVVVHGLSRNFVVWCKLSPKRPFFKAQKMA